MSKSNLEKCREAHELSIKKFNEERIKCEFGATDETIEQCRVAWEAYQLAIDEALHIDASSSLSYGNLKKKP